MTNKIDILAIGVHPDDIELGCGGTIVKHIDLGFTVGALLILRKVSWEHVDLQKD